MKQVTIYFTQLDALRAISVILVMLYHWLPSVPFFHEHQIGPYGVSIFFVLSGFLITRGLLIDKYQLTAGKTTLSNRYKNFIVKRSLRIFPIYCLFLAVLYGLNFETIRAEIPWHALYASNILYFINGEFSNGLAHLWSLAVEEQFYLFWPFFILFIPKNYLKYGLIFIIVLGAIFFYFLANYPNGTLLMPARIDAFGWGGLLAYIMSLKSNWIVKLNKLKSPIILFSILFISIEFGLLHQLDWLKHPLFYMLVTWVIFKLCGGVKGWIGNLLNWPPVLYLGKISYGIYLYHNVMQWLLPYFMKLLHIPVPLNQGLRFILFFTVTLTVSSVSYYIIEKPILRYKNRIGHA